MTTLIKTHKLYTDVSYHKWVGDSQNILIGIVVENVLRAFQWEALLLRAIFDANNASMILTGIKSETFTQLEHPEVIINEEPCKRIDVRDTDELKIAQRAEKKKSGGKKKINRTDEKKKAEEKRNQRKAEEEERLRKWEESWEKKLQAEEELDDVECCKGEGFSLKPKTQSNIWINVTKDRMFQEIQMAFKQVPVPRPKPPPLPPFKRVETSEDVRGERAQIFDKKSGKSKKKQ